jgi:hypothetical protein
MFKSLVLPALLLAGAVCAPAAQAAPTIALSARCSDARVCAPTAALAVQVDEPLDGGSLSLAAPGLSLGHPTLTGPEGRQVLDCDGGFHYCRFGALSAGDHTLTVSARPADGQFELRASMAYVQGGDAGLTDAAPLSWTLSGAGGERFTGPELPPGLPALDRPLASTLSARGGFLTLSVGCGCPAGCVATVLTLRAGGRRLRRALPALPAGAGHTLRLRLPARLRWGARRTVTGWVSVGDEPAGRLRLRVGR